MISLSELARVTRTSEAKLIRLYGRKRFYPDEYAKLRISPKDHSEVLRTAPAKRIAEGRMHPNTPLAIHKVWRESDKYWCNVTCICGFNTDMLYKTAQRISSCDGYLHLKA